MLIATAGHQDGPDVMQFLTFDAKNVQMSKKVTVVNSLIIQWINNYITKQKQKPSRGLSKWTCYLLITHIKMQLITLTSLVFFTRVTQK